MDSFIGMISADSANIVHIKLNLKKYERILDPDNLYKYIEQKYDPQKDIFLTGSNAFLLSSDLATLLA